ncbi:MAG TPA: hypothetical protein VK836_06715 [Streptosporangiaceae bacterium]|nr:hypothetical protein [Streptosporangiaceae bacterium]
MMAGTLRVRRSQGALSGALLVLLGIWGALIPFVGPYFHYAYTPDRAWVATSARMWLEVLPGVVTMAGGIVVLVSRFRPTAVLGAWLAAVAGAWFAAGDVIAGRWARLPQPGTPAGGPARAVLEQIGFFTGLGIVIVFVAALALGRFTVVGARQAAAAARSDAATAQKSATAARSGTSVAAGAASRSMAKVRAVPVVLRARRESAAANAAAGRAAAEADLSKAEAAKAKADAGQA